MRSGEKFTLTEAWWKAGKPALLLKTGISEALRAYETAHKTYGSTPNAANYTQALKLLEAVEKARLVGIDKCGSKEMFQTTKDALKANAAILERRDYYWKHYLAIVKGQIEDLYKILEPETKAAENSHKEATGLLQKALQHQIRLKPAVKVIQTAKAGTQEWLDAKTVQHKEGIPLKEISLRLTTLAELGAKQQYPSLDKAKSLVSSLPTIPFEGYFKTQFSAVEGMLKARADNQKKFQALPGMATAVKKAVAEAGSGF